MQAHAKQKEALKTVAKIGGDKGVDNYQIEIAEKPETFLDSSHFEGGYIPKTASEQQQYNNRKFNEGKWMGALAQ